MKVFNSLCALVIALGAFATSSCQLNSPSGSTAKAEEPPIAEPLLPGPLGAPRVFLALHGTQELANNSANDPKWAYVRENLNGLWGNAAGMSVDEVARMWRKVKTRRIIAEAALPADPLAPTPSARALDGQLHTFFPGIILNREGVAIYTPNSEVWNGRSVASMIEKYINCEPEYRYKNIYTGWNINNWVDPTWPDPNAARVARPITGDGALAVKQATGMFVEVAAYHCRQNDSLMTLALERAIITTHNAHKPFIWFTSPMVAPATVPSPPRVGALDLFKNTYQIIANKGLWRVNDVVMIINYREEYPMVPETMNGQPADTITGMLYWALKQRNPGAVN